MVINCAAVLRPHIAALTILRGRIMAVEERLAEPFVTDFLGIIGQLQRFCMPRATRADLRAAKFRHWSEGFQLARVMPEPVCKMLLTNVVLRSY